VFCALGVSYFPHAKHLLQRRSIITGIKSKPHLFYLHDLVIFCPIQSSLFSQTIQLQRYREDIHIQRQILNGYAYMYNIYNISSGFWWNVVSKDRRSPCKLTDYLHEYSYNRLKSANQVTTY
jgi:hypothetical protein